MCARRPIPDELQDRGRRISRGRRRLSRGRAEARLVFTWAWHSTPERESLVTVTVGQGRRRHHAHPASRTVLRREARDGHKRGWTGTLESSNATSIGNELKIGRDAHCVLSPTIQGQIWFLPADRADDTGRAHEQFRQGEKSQVMKDPLQMGKLDTQELKNAAAA